MGPLTCHVLAIFRLQVSGPEKYSSSDKSQEQQKIWKYDMNESF